MSQLLLAISPLAAMMFVSSITPGPNNMMLMLSGTQHGFARTIPHLVGVTLGTALLVCLTYLGVGTLLLDYPRVVDAMTVACAGYLLWMARRLLASKPANASPATEAAARPMNLREGLTFQFVNPKVWTMALAASGIAAHFPFSPLFNGALVAVVTTLINLPCISVWAAFGKALRRHLAHARNKRIFDGSMALLVVMTALWIVWPVFDGAV
jgi:threonine/homoserine/homoserine lactone efflux protein